MKRKTEREDERKEQERNREEPYTETLPQKQKDGKR